MDTPKRSLLIVDDDQFLASLLDSLLQSHNFETHVAHDVSSAMKLIRTTDLDAALVDINLGAGPSGIQLATALEKSYPGIGIIFLTRTPDLVAAGINPKSLPKGSGVVGKDNLENSTELVDAIESVLTRNSPVRHDATAKSLIGSLTSHQLEVLKDVAMGLTNKTIAIKHDITERSVERVLQAIFTKLDIEPNADLNPRVEAVRRYTDYLGVPPRSS